MSLGRLVAAAVTLIVSTVALTVVGLEPVFALSGGVLAAAGVILLALRGARTDIDDGPRGEPARHDRGSAVSRLAWGFNPRTDVAGEIVARRVRALLCRRLARRGIDVDDPADAHAVDAVLGTGVWERLITRKATLIDIEHALDTTERRSEESS